MDPVAAASTMWPDNAGNSEELSVVKHIAIAQLIEITRQLADHRAAAHLDDLERDVAYRSC
jgi:hypothetical protein